MQFNSVPVLVLGDVMLDHYITGIVSRISPEAPVPVVSRQSSWTVPGGAANVALGLARLGCDTRLAGFAGMDPSGAALRQKLNAEGINSILISSDNRPTTCKTRIMAGGQQILRLDEEKIKKPSLEERIALLHALEELIVECKAVVLSDYAKGVLLRDKNGQSVCAEAIAMASERKIPILVDPKGTDWNRYAGADCVTPNFGEFKQVCQYNDVEFNNNEISQLAANLCSRYLLERILLTRGSEGMILFEKYKSPLRLAAAVREVADVSGAGDTVIATLAACVATGIPWEKSAEIANMAAGIAVGKTGAAPVGIEELNGMFLKQDENIKIFTLANLQKKISQWHANGLKIVFTNGCFDLLHPGHISLLRECASLGDKLIVGLNTDDSVQRLKGKDRPIQNENNRAMVLGALQYVDAITFFAEDTPQQIIEALRPDILVKGSDYNIENVVGADFVKSYGGKVHLAKLIDGCSTTGLVEHMKSGS